MPFPDKEPCHQCGKDLPPNWPMNFCNRVCSRNYARKQRLTREYVTHVTKVYEEIERRLSERKLTISQAKVEHGRYLIELRESSGRRVMGNGPKFSTAIENALEAHRCEIS